MTVTVDVSAKELRPDAVLKLINEHVKDRGHENILFKVSRETYDLVVKQKPAAVSVSKEEAAKINAFVKKTAEPDEYTLDKKFSCSKCGRELNFFDVFESGRKRHGDDYTRRFLGGDDFYVQVLKEDHELETECTQCGTLNMLGPCASYTTSQY